jgi:hypothetical protein
MLMQLNSRITLAACIGALALESCADDSSTSPARLGEGLRQLVAAPLQVDSIPLDTKLLAIERVSPGFGGMYWNAPNSLTIVHTDSSALVRTLAAIQLVMGDVPALHASQTILRVAKYSFKQLRDFRSAIEHAVDVSGLIYSDLDEVNNYAWFGVRTDAVVQEVRAAVTAAGFPSDAVVAEVVRPPQLLGGTLADRQDTTQGGLFIGSNHGNFCSIGFNFTRWGTAQYMMTAAHCSPPIGSINSSYWFSQPYFNTEEAQEFGDPPATALPGCLEGRLCRNADAAQFMWRFSPQTFGLGLIAAPRPGTASSTWGVSGGRDAYTYFTIVGEAPDSWLLPSAQVSKIGTTTGLTRGAVTRACETFYAYFTLGADILCETMTNVPVDGGDSGGPYVYGWPEPQDPPATTPVYLAGILSSGGPETMESGFSSWAAIVRDFGNVQTYPSKPCC